MVDVARSSGWPTDPERVRAIQRASLIAAPVIISAALGPLGLAVLLMSVWESLQWSAGGLALLLAGLVASIPSASCVARMIGERLDVRRRRRETDALEARGEIVLGGSFTAPIHAARGDVFHVDYGPLGSISARFA